MHPALILREVIFGVLPHPIWRELIPGGWRNAAAPRSFIPSASKRGDRHLRMLMIHGARAVLGKAAGKADPRSLWIGQMRERRHPNVAAVAIANMNARIVWAFLSSGETYRPGQAVTRPALDALGECSIRHEGREPTESIEQHQAHRGIPYSIFH